MRMFSIVVLILLLTAIPITANSVYYPGKGNGDGTFNIYYDGNDIAAKIEEYSIIGAIVVVLFVGFVLFKCWGY